MGGDGTEREGGSPTPGGRWRWDLGSILQPCIHAGHHESQHAQCTEGEHLCITACRKSCPLPSNSCWLGTRAMPRPPDRSVRQGGHPTSALPALSVPRRRCGGEDGLHPPGGGHRAGSRPEDLQPGSAMGATTWTPCVTVIPRTPAHRQAPTQDTFAHGMAPWYPGPLHSHGCYQHQAQPLSVKGQWLHWHCPHTASPAQCQQLPAHPTPAVGHAPCPPHGAGWHMRCQGYHQPSHSETSSRSLAGAVGKGCRVKPKWGRRRMGGSQGGPCWGKALGLSLAEVLLQLLLLWTLLHPSWPPCGTEKGDKAGDRGWPHGGSCQHRALQVSL